MFFFSVTGTIQMRYDDDDSILEIHLLFSQNLTNAFDILVLP